MHCYHIHKSNNEKVPLKSNIGKRFSQVSKGSQTHDHPDTSWNALTTELWATHGEPGHILGPYGDTCPASPLTTSRP